MRVGFAGERIRFATLTWSGHAKLTEQYVEIKKAWNRLRLELSRKFKLTKYFWVLEGTPSTARPHLHILLNRYIPQKILSKLAQNAGFVSVCDIRAVRDDGVFNYVRKYLGKGLGSITAERTLRAVRGRRFGKSRNIKTLGGQKETWFTIDESDSVDLIGMLTEVYNQFGIRLCTDIHYTKQNEHII